MRVQLMPQGFIVYHRSDKMCRCSPALHFLFGQSRSKREQNSVEHVNRSDIELVNKYLRALYNYGVGMCGKWFQWFVGANIAQEVYAIMRL